MKCKHKWHGFGLGYTQKIRLHELIEVAIFVCEKCGTKKELETK